MKSLYFQQNISGVFKQGKESAGQETFSLTTDISGGLCANLIMRRKSRGFRGISVIAVALVAVLVAVPAATSYADENRIAVKHDVASDSNAKKKPDENHSGTGQLEVSIHGMQGIAKNKEKVVIIVDGAEYVATLKGETLIFTMDTEDNGFLIGPEESIDIEFVSSKGSGIITIRHQEGNGDDIIDEDDQGLNNYNGTYEFDDEPSESETEESTEETSAEETIESTEESSEEETSETETEESEETSAEETLKSSEESSEEETSETEAEESKETSAEETLESTEESSDEETSGTDESTEETSPESGSSKEDPTETQPQESSEETEADETAETDPTDVSDEESEVIAPTGPDHDDHSGYGWERTEHDPSNETPRIVEPISEDVPLMKVELEDSIIPKAEIKLAGLPKTGDSRISCSQLMLISGLLVVFLRKKSYWKEKMTK